MDKTILTITKIVSLLLIALAVIMQIVVLVKGEDRLIGSGVLDNYILLGYVAIGLTAIFAFLFPIISMIKNPKNSLKILGTLVLLTIIGFICFSMAKNNLNIEQLEQLKTTAQISKIVGASIYFAYIIGGLAILSIIFSSVSSFFK